jgi:hypothetical protein
VRSGTGLGRLRQPAAGQRPSDPCRVVLLLRSDVLFAGDVPPIVITSAARAAGDDVLDGLAVAGTVAVALVLRIHGSALGLPNPGLLPTARERSAGEDRMAAAIQALRMAGAQADGEIVITRNPARAVARMARRRSADVVLVEPTPSGRIRRFLEGDVSRQLNRRLARDIRVAEIPGC